MGWTWLDEEREDHSHCSLTECAHREEGGCTAGEIDAAIHAELDALDRRRLSMLADREREGWEAEARAEEGWDPYEDLSEEEYAQVQAQRKVRELEEQAALEAIVERMAELGARPMRPYEQWNEDERLVEWMERDR